MSHGPSAGNPMAGTHAELAQTLPAVTSSVPVLRHAVAQFAREAGATGAALENLRLAVSEAVTNAVVHAYADQDEPGPVSLTACILGATIDVTVSDAGCGLIPRVDSPGLRLGLPLMAHAADTLAMQPAPGGGTELRMSFWLKR